MKTVSIDQITSELYIPYLEKANKIQEMGLHLDKTDVELAQLIYEKEVMNENKKSD